MPRDVIALLRFAASHGFLRDALIGLVATALSDYRQLRAKGRVAALQRGRDGRQTGGGGIHRLPRPFQYRAQPLADDLRGAARPEPAAGGLGLTDDRRSSPRRDRR